MNIPTVDIAAWRNALPRLPRIGIDRILIVQCTLDWLRPTHRALRDEIDDAVVHLTTRHATLRIDRLLLHNLPTIQGVRDGDLADLNAAHTEWTGRLATTSRLLQRHQNLQIHRLIVKGDQASLDVEDLIDLHSAGAWLHPRHSRPILELLSEGRRTTPLTGYDVDLDGPFGDVDPSIYI